MVINLLITRENWKWKFDHDQETLKIYLEDGCKNVIFFFSDRFILFKSYEFFHTIMEEIYKFKIPTPKDKEKWKMWGSQGVL